MAIDNFKAASSPLRVMHVIGRLHYGGIETIIRDFARHLPRERIVQSVCCISSHEGALTQEVRSEGVSIHVLPYTSRRIFNFVRNFSALVKTENIDLVHSHIFFSTVWIAFAADLGGARGFISTIHGLYHLPWNKFLELRLLNMFGNRFISRNVCVSSAVLKHSQKLFGLNRTSYRVIPNGIDTNVFSGNYDSTSSLMELGIPSCALKIGTIGSLRKVKNHAMFIRVLLQVIDSGIDAYGVIVGAGPLKSCLEAEARSLGIQNRIIFAGERNDIPMLLCGFDIFAHTSFYEGAGNVILEAMSSRLPVVVTSFEAAKEIVRHEKNGFIVPINDDCAMAEMITYLHRDPAARHIIGKAARVHVEKHFDVKRMVADYEDLYHEVVVKAL